MTPEEIEEANRTLDAARKGDGYIRLDARRAGRARRLLALAVAAEMRGWPFDMRPLEPQIIEGTGRPLGRGLLSP